MAKKLDISLRHLQNVPDSKDERKEKGKAKTVCGCLAASSLEILQSWAKEWALGCVNSPPRGQRESGGGIHAT